MAFNLDLLNKDTVNKTKIQKKVYVPNGDVSLVTHTGNSSLSDTSTISNMFYVPYFQYNFLLVAKLTKKL